MIKWHRLEQKGVGLAMPDIERGVNMTERDPHFALAIDEIEKGIEESLKKLLETKKEKPMKKTA